MIGAVPVQVPVPAVSVWPSRAAPETGGIDRVGRGDRVDLTARRPSGAVAEPASFEAVTSLRIVEPTSAPVST